jgi:hypothetical protein
MLWEYPPDAKSKSFARRDVKAGLVLRLSSSSKELYSSDSIVFVCSRRKVSFGFGGPE